MLSVMPYKSPRHQPVTVKLLSRNYSLCVVIHCAASLCPRRDRPIVNNLIKCHHYKIPEKNLVFHSATHFAVAATNHSALSSNKMRSDEMRWEHWHEWSFIGLSWWLKVSNRSTFHGQISELLLKKAKEIPYYILETHILVSICFAGKIFSLMSLGSGFLPVIEDLGSLNPLKLRSYATAFDCHA